MPTTRKVAKKASARPKTAGKVAKKRPAMKRGTTTPSAAARKKTTTSALRMTVAELAAKLRADIPGAPPSLRGANVPIQLLRSQYGPLPKRTIAAALNILASEGLVTIVNDETFQMTPVPSTVLGE